MNSTLKRREYKKNAKKSLCKGKTVKKCPKVKGCKNAKGSKKTFCRKIKNKSYKNNK
jgi:hypothetical protein